MQREADDDISGEQARMLRLDLTSAQMKIAALQQELDTARLEKLQATTAKEMVGRRPRTRDSGRDASRRGA